MTDDIIPASAVRALSEKWHAGELDYPLITYLDALLASASIAAPASKGECWAASERDAMERIIGARVIRAEDDGSLMVRDERGDFAIWWKAEPVAAPASAWMPIVDHRCPEIGADTLHGAFVSGAKWWESGADSADSRGRGAASSQGRSRRANHARRHVARYRAEGVPQSAPSAH